MKSFIRHLASVAPLVGLPMLTLAAQFNTATIPGFNQGIRDTININDLSTILLNIANVIFFLLVIITTFFVLYAAYLYLTSGGEAETTAKARNFIIYAAIALAVGFFARALPGIVAGVVNQS